MPASQAGAPELQSQLHLLISISHWIRPLEGSRWQLIHTAVLVASFVPSFDTAHQLSPLQAFEEPNDGLRQPLSFSTSVSLPHIKYFKSISYKIHFLWNEIVLQLKSRLRVSSSTVILLFTSLQISLSALPPVDPSASFTIVFPMPRTLHLMAWMNLLSLVSALYSFVTKLFIKDVSIWDQHWQSNVYD